MIINHWGPEFTKLYGHVFPENYIAFDCEFSGPTEKDLVFEIGHTLVVGCRVVDQLNIVLDWSLDPTVPDHWIRGAIGRITQKMLHRGDRWRVQWDVMKREGIHPKKALDFYYKLFDVALDKGYPLVGHNVWHSEVKVMQNQFEGTLDVSYPFEELMIFDTGAIVKATKALEEGDEKIRSRAKGWLPLPGDSLKDYFQRCIHAQAPGILWNLGQAIRDYDLHTEYGLDMSNQHQAQFDSQLCVYLMEEFRSRITRTNKDENPFQSPETFQRTFNEQMAKKKLAKEKRDRAKLAREQEKENEWAQEVAEVNERPSKKKKFKRPKGRRQRVV